MNRLLLVGVAAGALLLPTGASAGTLPPGFQETTAISGLTNPTVVRFAPDGRVFVAEKSGLIKVFDGLDDATPTVFADLRTEVYNIWDRGLLGMELSPDWAQDPAVYVLYTRDAVVGGPAPLWGNPDPSGSTSDPCPTPPGVNEDGCVVSGRLARLPVSGEVSGELTPLIDDWCQQFPSHSVGSLEFDEQGRLIASAGDGASFNDEDWGQYGEPLNPCGDPPTGPGTALTPPTAEGGALRSQDLRTDADPAGLNGTIIRIDPADGSGVSGNPLSSSVDANERRVLAHGLRNPFRFTLAADGDVWIGDVGWTGWEEINHLSDFGSLTNFGWPCYEGAGRQVGYDSENLSICESLYSSGGVTPPFFAYSHSDRVVEDEACPIGSSSIAGLSFYDGASFPSEYANALLFADYSRNCIWVMLADEEGEPDPEAVVTFDAGAMGPVNLEVGPDGALYYPAFSGNRIQRIQYASGNQPPLAFADAEPRSGHPPLDVAFDGSRSSDPDLGDTIRYEWDLDGDGAYDDSTEPTASHTYNEGGSYEASLRVTDSHGASATAAVTIEVGNTPPAPAILGPTSSTRWKVGKEIAFSGSADDPEEGSLPPSALDWTLILRHCPSKCHSHPLESFEGTDAGSFNAPDHKYPSSLKLRLTATDAGGLSASESVRLRPRTVSLRMAANHRRVRLTLNGETARAPFKRRVIKGSANTIGASSPQRVGRRRYGFRRWSDGGKRTHSITATRSRTYRARFRRSR